MRNSFMVLVGLVKIDGRVGRWGVAATLPGDDRMLSPYARRLIAMTLVKIDLPELSPYHLLEGNAEQTDMPAKEGGGEGGENRSGEDGNRQAMYLRILHVACQLQVPCS